WVYTKTRTVFLGADSSVKLSFELDKVATEKRKQRKQRLKKENSEKYVDNGDGTVTDKTTGLMWKKCSEGQNGNNCTGTAKTYKWQAALDHAKTVNFAGHSDWRLPTIKELHSLVFCSNGKVRKFKDNDRDSDSCRSKAKGNYESPTINQISFPNTPASIFWSSSPHSSKSNYALIVYFDYGYDGVSNHNGSNRLRLVRSGQ
ncbi:MAG: DUF1566 domain-containing protein, partial [Gammaproteobacteria bacterium]|nr:DUF1566 domain-containing protein [Gammaproteobacteria bacterium]